MPTSVPEGRLYYEEYRGPEFTREDGKGRRYSMRYAGLARVNGAEVHVYEAHAVRRSVTPQARLLDRLDYCLHRYWGIEADPRYSYLNAVGLLCAATLQRICKQAEVTFLLMSRHAARHELVMSTYNKLVELLGMAFGTVFSLCPVSGVLMAELLQ
jgi:hypothetical protein